MRINPILNWTYGDVWAFLHDVGAMHCSLYDHGYTSLGSVTDTKPNSALRRPDGTYAPAHELNGVTFGVSAISIALWGFM
jgi:FAD synthetase